MVIRFQFDIGQGFFDVNPPANAVGLRPWIQFYDGVVQATIAETTLEWTGQEAVILQQYRDAGLTGGTGIYEGPGIRCFACDAPGVMFIDGFHDLQNLETRWECDKVSAPFKQRITKQFVEERAGGIDFNFLVGLAPGTPGRIIPATDYLLLPYTVSTVGRTQTASQKILITVTFFLTVEKLYDTTCKTIQLTSELIGWTSTTGATLGATVFSLLSMIFQITTYVLYVGLMLFSLITMFINIIREIIQLKKYKLCMLDSVIMQRVSEYFNLNFSSTILQQSNWRNSTYLPEKNVIPDTLNPLSVFRRHYDESQNFPNNPDVSGHPDMNVGEYIRELCEFYEAGISVIGNTLYLEKKRHFNQFSVFTITNTGEVGYTQNLPHPSRTNAAELPSNYQIEFAWKNTGDLNNKHRFAGTRVSVNVAPQIVNNVQRVGHTLGKLIQFRVARAVRKYYLNEVEHAINAVLTALFTLVNTVLSLLNAIINFINTVISIFGGNSTTIPTIPLLPTNIINNRIGWLELSDDTTTAPKRFLGESQGGDWVISQNNDVYMTADAIFEEFHAANLATRGAQANIYDKNRFKFCCEDFVNILNTNCITTPNGLIGKFRGGFYWNIATEQAEDAEYEEYVNFTNNLQETKKID